MFINSTPSPLKRSKLWKANEIALIDKIAEVYSEKLKQIFNFVSDKPLKLFNTKNVPIYHFVFASNNKTAHKIAKQILAYRQAGLKIKENEYHKNRMDGSNLESHPTSNQLNLEVKKTSKK